MSRLREILKTKATEVAFRRQVCPLSAVEAAARARAEPVRDFVQALRAAPEAPAIIAEVKRASPSKGILRPSVDVAAFARMYAANGAAAISILTDHVFFGGDSFDLAVARAAVPLPVLRKDFVIDEYQIFESRAMGADAVLLVVAALDQARVETLHRLASELGLAVVVEVHNERELEVAETAGAQIIGVNARNLATFTVDIGVVERLLPSVPATATRLAESGVRARDDVVRLGDAGAEAILVGEKLMTAKDPGVELRVLRGK